MTTMMLITCSQILDSQLIRYQMPSLCMGVSIAPAHARTHTALAAPCVPRRPEFSHVCLACWQGQRIRGGDYPTDSGRCACGRQPSAARRLGVYLHVHACVRVYVPSWVLPRDVEMKMLLLGAGRGVGVSRCPLLVLCRDRIMQAVALALAGGRVILCRDGAVVLHDVYAW